MARIIKWWLDRGIAGADLSGEIEMEDDASHEEIEEAVRDEAFNFISWGWNEDTTPAQRQGTADVPGGQG